LIDINDFLVDKKISSPNIFLILYKASLKFFFANVSSHSAHNIFIASSLDIFLLMQA